MSAGWFLLGLMAGSAQKPSGCPKCGCPGYRPPPPPKPVQEPEEPLTWQGTLALLVLAGCCIGLVLFLGPPGCVSMHDPELTLRSPIRIDSRPWDLTPNIPSGPGDK